jgi:tRNA pseudouridine38-40 synthase
MARYQVTIAYDGTHFRGYQRQATGRTVQGIVEAGLRKLGWQSKSILAAGRTDAGVHAAGQVIAFDLAWEHSVQALKQALNAHLPCDVVVHQVKLAHPTFHPRNDAIARRYAYAVFSQAERDPLRERYAWRIWPPADLDRLHQAAACLIGTYDFAAFGTPPRIGDSTVRQVMQAAWKVEKAQWVFEITADAFLYHMVRRVVSFQIAIAQGQKPFDLLPLSLQKPAGPAEMVQGLAPPQGLVLTEVKYPSQEVFPGQYLED